MSTRRQIRWSFDNDEKVYDGVTNDTGWNGWLNVWVTEDVHRAVMAAMDPEELEASGMAEMKPDPDGLYSYADGFTAQEVG